MQLRQPRTYFAVAGVVVVLLVIALLPTGEPAPIQFVHAPLSHTTARPSSPKPPTSVPATLIPATPHSKEASIEGLQLVENSWMDFTLMWQPDPAAMSYAVAINGAPSITVADTSVSLPWPASAGNVFVRVCGQDAAGHRSSCASIVVVPPIPGAAKGAAEQAPARPQARRTTVVKPTPTTGQSTPQPSAPPTTSAPAPATPTMTATPAPTPTPTPTPTPPVTSTPTPTPSPTTRPGFIAPSPSPTPAPGTPTII